MVEYPNCVGLKVVKQSFLKLNGLKNSVSLKTMKNIRENMRYLQLLAKDFPNVSAVTTEIINLNMDQGKKKSMHLSYLVYLGHSQQKSIEFGIKYT